MALKLKIPTNAAETTFFTAYLRDTDVKQIAFGVNNFANPAYTPPAEGEAEPEVPKTIERKYCRIVFNELVEQETPYQSYKMNGDKVKVGRDGKPLIEVKMKKETINNFQIIFDETQFAYLEEFATNLK